MEILVGGAAVSLADAAVLEKLKNTAVRLADKAAASNGFVNGDGTAERMADEFWNALSYRCDDSEAEKIRSIFTGRFVRRLGGDAVESEVVVESATTVEAVTEAERETTIIEEPENADKAEMKTVETVTKATGDTEPLRFDQCTVTIVVNLLPSENGRRTAVVSLRTHDFAPQIKVCNVDDVNIPDALFPAIGEAISNYRARLPELAIEKLRAEKATAKKKPAAKQSKRTKAAEPKPVAESLF